VRVAQAVPHLLVRGLLTAQPIRVVAGILLVDQVVRLSATASVARQAPALVVGVGAVLVAPTVAAVAVAEAAQEVRAARLFQVVLSAVVAAEREAAQILASLEKLETLLAVLFIPIRF